MLIGGKYFVLFFILSLTSVGIFINFIDTANATSNDIPDWFQDNVQWWNEGLIEDDDIVDGLENLIGRDILSVDYENCLICQNTEYTLGEKPLSTVKTILNFWTEGKIESQEMEQIIQLMVNEDVLNLSDIKKTETKILEKYDYSTRGGNAAWNSAPTNAAVWNTSDEDSSNQSTEVVSPAIKFSDNASTDNQFTDTQSAASQYVANTNTNNQKTFLDAATVDAKKSEADVTVLVYMVGSNLEHSNKATIKGFRATDDIIEMKNGNPKDNINVILATGGSAEAKPQGLRTIDFTIPSIHQVVGNDVKPVSQLGTKSMSSPALLTDFIETSVKLFPAKQYVLIMWNHGFGYDGYAYDNAVQTPNNNDRQMSLVQIQNALANSHDKNGKQVKFELIGFDACLMATYHVAEKLEGFGNYLVASQENEPGSGWKYDEIISYLNNNSNPVDGLSLGQKIIESYHQSLLDLKQNNKPELIATLSVIDLRNFDNMRTTFNDFVAYVKGFDKNGPNLPKLSSALNNVERYGASPGVDPDHIDLAHFMTAFGDEFIGVTNNAGKVWTTENNNDMIKEVKKVALDSKSGTSKPNASGLSLYWPRVITTSTDQSGLVPEHRGLSDVSISQNTEENQLVDFYMDYLESDNIAPTFDVEFDGHNTISGNYYGNNDVYEINFYFTSPTAPPAGESGEWLEVYHTDEFGPDEVEGLSDFRNSEINFVWDGLEPSLCNEDFCYPISPDWEWGDTVDLAYLPVILLAHENDPDGVIGSLIYDITEDWNGDFIGFLPAGEKVGDVSKELLDLEDGQIIQIRTVDVSKDFSKTSFTKVEKLRVDDTFGMYWEMYNWGELEVYVEVCDFSGNCSAPKGPFIMDSQFMDPPADYPSNYQRIEWDQKDPLNPRDEDYTETCDTEYCFEDYEYLDNGCPVGFPYIWSDGYCYDTPETDVPDLLSNGCPVGFPYIWSDGYCYDTPETEILDNGCPEDYPYLWSDDYCYDVLEPKILDNGCPEDYPYLWSDDYCYDYPETEILDNGCPEDYPYLWSDGYCESYPEPILLDNGCPEDYPYLWSDGFCYDTLNPVDDGSVLVTYFCDEIHSVYDYYLGSQEVENICIDAQSYGDSISLDIADNYWNELDSKFMEITSTDTSDVPSYCNDNYDGTITCSDNYGTFTCSLDNSEWICGDYLQTISEIPSNCTDYGYGFVECYDTAESVYYWCYPDENDGWTDCYYPEDTSGGYETEYLDNGCHVDTPYLWSDGYCYSVPEDTSGGYEN